MDVMVREAPTAFVADDCDLGRMFRVSESLRYGQVGVNEGVITTEVAPFGGVKESGLGREGSKYGIEDYVVVKYLCMGGVDR